MNAKWPVLAALTVQACTASTGPIANHPVDVELTLHETKPVPGTTLALTFDRVLGDSRCPVDVMCVWAGNAEMEISTTWLGNVQETHRLNSFLEPHTFDVGGYRVTFRRLDPEPREGVAIDSADYRIDLSVEGR